MEDSFRNHLRCLVDSAFLESIETKEALRLEASGLILDMALVIDEAFRGGRKLFIFGNGGSAADSQHLAAEFVNRFQRERPPLPALALTVDTSVLTSISNDYLFEDIFLKQLTALGQPGDVALGISTSGRSPNVLKGLKWASEHGIRTLGFSGPVETEMDLCCDFTLHVPSKVTARIQESHITAGHIICALTEEMLFADFNGEDA